MHCRLLVPDLWPPEPEFAGALSTRFPKLETLMARGRASDAPWSSVAQWLLEAFSVPRQVDWPSAPYALLGEGRAPGDTFWAHADPVHLRADGDRLLVADPSLLELTLDEATELAGTLSNHFRGSLALEPVAPLRWFAQLEAPPEQPTTPLGEVAGRALHIESAPLRWHALMNEMQMLLHEHPVNQAREARGAVPVNGVWLWGGGRMGEVQSPGLRSVLSDAPLARGLATAGGVRSGRLPRDAGRWLAEGDADGVHLVVLDRLSAARRRSAPAEWLAALESLERDWFAPLVEALQRGRIGMVSLHLAAEHALLQTETTRTDLRHFWRRRKSLAQVAPAL